MEQQNTINQEQYIDLLEKIKHQTEEINFLKQNLAFVEQEQRNLIYLEGFVFASDETREAVHTLHKMARNAKKSIVLYDSCISPFTLHLFEGKNKDVPLTIITSSESSISQKDIDTFTKEHGKLDIKVGNKKEKESFLHFDDEFFYCLSDHLDCVGSNEYFIFSRLHDDWCFEGMKKNYCGIEKA